MLQDGANPSTADKGLVLNIWTPAQSGEEKLPVYMLVHGGANRSGSNSEDELYAAELAAKGLVVVSVNYRLGALGFLALPEMAKENEHGTVGNFAILDLIKALNWIKSNISGFGGDPDAITIGGQSSGAENVVALIRSPLAKGLFKRAFISSSFTGFLPGKNVAAEQKTKANQEAVNRLFGKEMTLNDLRAIPAAALLEPWNGRNSLYGQLAASTVTRQFYTVDGKTFTDDSIDLLRPGVFDGLSIMIGQTADELTSLRGGTDKELSEEEFRAAIQKPEYPYMVGGYDARILDLYQPQTPLDAYRLSLRAVADRMFAYVKIGAEYVKTHNDANVWLFYWDHVPPGNNEGFRRAYHASDLYYFNASLRVGKEDQPRWTDPDFSMKELASSYLANFIKTGNPNGDGLPQWGEVVEGSGDSQFLRFHEGEGRMVTGTVYPSRDAYHREMILTGLNMTEHEILGR
jgi:para-nitrobenzyl esterase